MNAKFLAMVATVSLLSVGGVVTSCDSGTTDPKPAESPADTKDPCAGAKDPCAGDKKDPCAGAKDPCAGDKKDPCAGKKDPCAGS